MTNTLFDSISATQNDSKTLIFNINHSKETVEHLIDSTTNVTFVKFDGDAATGLKLVRCDSDATGARILRLSKDSKTKKQNGKGKTSVPYYKIGFPEVKFKAIPIELKKIKEGIQFPPLTEESLRILIDENNKQSDPIDLDSVDDHGLDPNNTAGQELNMTEDQVDDRLRREIDRLEHEGRPGIDESMDNLKEALQGRTFTGKVTIDGKFEMKV